MTLGFRLRDLRMDAGLTLAELSKPCDVSPQHLSDLERDRRTPSLDVLDRISRAFEMKVVHVLDGVVPYGAD